MSNFSSSTNIKEIDSGGCSTIIVDVEDNVYVAGENTKGLLGLDSTDWKQKVCTFTKIPALLQRKVIKVSYDERCSSSCRQWG